ncbi:MAG: tetratricopeptide repeat protein [Desulfobacteraceae bacterium]|jgi:tetratricopeptide (TPR) repeat protein
MIRKIMIIALLLVFWSLPATALDSIEDAEMSFAKGEFKQASKQAEKLLKTQPDNIRAGIVLAECHNESQKYMKAISIYKDLIKKAPDNMELVFRLGIVYNNAEYHANAVDVYKQIVAVQPENMKAHHRLGISYALCMDLSAAYDEFRILKKRDEKLANDLLQYIQTNDK